MREDNRSNMRRIKALDRRKRKDSMWTMTKLVENGAARQRGWLSTWKSSSRWISSAVGCSGRRFLLVRFFIFIYHLSFIGEIIWKFKTFSYFSIFPKKYITFNICYMTFTYFFIKYYGYLFLIISYITQLWHVINYNECQIQKFYRIITVRLAFNEKINNIRIIKYHI